MKVITKLIVLLTVGIIVICFNSCSSASGNKIDPTKEFGSAGWHLAHSRGDLATIRAMMGNASDYWYIDGYKDAILFNRIEIVKLFMEDEVDPNVVFTIEDKEYPSLCLLLTMKMPTFANGLINRGADPNVPMDEFNYYPMHIAISMLKNTNNMNYLMTVPLLIKNGANVNVQETKNDMTPLHMAIKYNLSGIARQLLKNKADPNIAGKFDGITNVTPLMSAVEMNNADLLSNLIATGANVNVQDSEGKTALINAAFWGKRDCVQILLEAGADKTLKDKKGRIANQTLNKECRELISQF